MSELIRRTYRDLDKERKEYEAQDRLMRSIKDHVLDEKSKRRFPIPKEHLNRDTILQMRYCLDNLPSETDPRGPSVAVKSSLGTALRHKTITLEVGFGQRRSGMHIPWSEHKFQLGREGNTLVRLSLEDLRRLSSDKKVKKQKSTTY